MNSSFCWIRLSMVKVEFLFLRWAGCFVLRALLPISLLEPAWLGLDSSVIVLLVFNLL